MSTLQVAIVIAHSIEIIDKWCGTSRRMWLCWRWIFHVFTHVQSCHWKLDKCVQFCANAGNLSKPQTCAVHNNCKMMTTGYFSKKNNVTKCKVYRELAVKFFNTEMSHWKQAKCEDTRNKPHPRPFLQKITLEGTATVSFTPLSLYQHPQLRGLCRNKVLLSACPCWRQLLHSNYGEYTRALVNGFTYTVFMPRNFSYLIRVLCITVSLT